MEFSVDITTGKAFDVLSLKGSSLQDISSYADFLRETVEKLYLTGGGTRLIERCPCCMSNTEDNTECTQRFIGIPVHTCMVCGHSFVLEQPHEQVLEKVFATSEQHSNIYIDQESIEARMREVINPKIDWCLNIYNEHFVANPKTSIDVGAGGGHFVEGMKRREIHAAGYELSESSRRFAKEAFGIDLLAEDFLTSNNNPVDLISFWGLLEYTPEPRIFLEAARQRLNNETGLLVVEVPRFQCLSTAAQAENPFSIARHMDPSTHVNTFSDSSLATALVETGFAPVAAWYFGMDVYEFLVQAALRLNDSEVIDRLADMIPAAQQVLDLGRQCDDFVVAAVPLP